MFGYLRLFLALLVVSSHFNGTIIKFVDQGRAAVFAFYILAGLVTSKLYLEVFNKDIKAFLKDRFLRIVPMAWVWLIIAILTIYFVYPQNLIITAKNLFYHFTIIPLSYFSFLDVQMLTKPHEAGMNFVLPPYFSLGVELQTYITLALLLYFRTLKYLRFAAIASFVSFAFVTTFGLGDAQLDTTFSYAVFTQVLFAFYIGVLIYYKKNQELIIWYLAIVGLLALHIARFASFGVSPTAQVAFILFIPVIKIMYDFKDIKLPLNHTLGSLSYIVYLNHMLFIYLINTDLINIKFSWQEFVIASFFSLLTALPAYYLIERPLNKIRHVK